MEKDIIFVKKMEDRELIEKCINYFKEEYKIYISDYQWVTYYSTPIFDFWIPDAIFYIDDLNKIGLAIKINQNKETYIKNDIVNFNDKKYICVDINNFDDFVKIFSEHFKKIDIWKIIGKKETLEIGF